MPDRTRNRNGGRPEFEVAYYTKELGQSLQREMLQKKFAQFSSDNGGSISSSHGEDAAPEVMAPPPTEDRAG